MKNELAVLEN